MDSEETIPHPLREAIVALIIGQFFNNFISLFYITQKLNVSFFVKRVLITEALMTMITAVCNGLGLGMIWFLEIRDNVSCGLLVDVTLTSFTIRNCLTMMMAIIRQRHLITRDKWLVLIIGWGYQECLRKWYNRSEEIGLKT